MARSLWTGSISFGLINIPISIVSTKEPAEIRFHLLDKRNQGRIGYKQFNKATGEEVSRDEIVKGYEYDKDRFVVITEKDFERANPKAAQTIDVEDFVKLEDIPVTYFEKPYYLIPQKGGEKGYALLRQVMANTHMVAVGRIVLHRKQRLVAIMPSENLLLLEVLRFQHEIAAPRDVLGSGPREIDHAAKISKREVDMAEKLLESMAGKWRPEKYHDTYHDDILRMIQRKIRTGSAIESHAPALSKTNSNVMDLMPLLKKSLEVQTRAKTKKGTRAHASH